MTSAQDLFGKGGGGSFPKVEELDGKLVLLKPSVIESVPNPEKFGGGVKDRLTADCVVFEDDGSYEVYEDMYFSQKGLVNPGRKALKPGAKPFVLGRVRMFPTSELKKTGIDTPEKLQQARADWLRKGGKGDEPRYGWGLDDYTAEEAAVAMKYVMDTSPMASGAEE